MRKIIERIFPKNLNNNYKGHKIALYVFYALTALTLWRSSGYRCLWFMGVVPVDYQYCLSNGFFTLSGYDSADVPADVC